MRVHKAETNESPKHMKALPTQSAIELSFVCRKEGYYYQKNFIDFNRLA